MIKTIFTILFVCLTQFLVVYQGQGQNRTNGKIENSISFESKLLEKSVAYSIYLPPDYYQSDKRYPCVYFFHGMGDDENAWFEKGSLHEYLDDCLAAGEIQAFIAIIPEGKNSFFINNKEATVRWEDFFVKEFIPAMDKKYRTLSSRESRGLVGISMGGFSSIVYLLKHPDLFIYGLAYSPAIMSEQFIRSISIGDWNDGYHEAFGRTVTKEERFSQHYYTYSPMHLVNASYQKSLKSVNLIVDCGKDDFLYPDNQAFHNTLNSFQLQHEFNVRDGGHGWEYWRAGLKNNLIKMSTCLK